ncbi:hypothetical protein DSO57_1000678 [Entomophthora muscae]|uniref:Uncharacterized protein n=1 Tax=Entomophthora muscae TaxID=34485 RepID=A0ACC2TWA7_9FUNG|nr:hypothetical protein DSO57_1000678 [Entomophthora muscae]
MFISLCLSGFVCICSSALLSGVTYSPYNAKGCLSSDEIAVDLEAISQVTDRIRLYGADCDQSNQILSAIHGNGWNLRVVLGLWTQAGEARLQSDLNAILDSLGDPVLSQAVQSIVVGNEDIYNGMSESQVISNLEHVRHTLRLSGYGKYQVSYAEVFSLWTPNLVRHSDTIMASIYPFYSENKGYPESVAQAAITSLGQLTQVAASLNASKTLIVGETGYPNAGSAPAMFSTPNATNQCAYLNSFRCNAGGLEYFFLEAKDGTWKGGYPTERHFGLMNSDGSLRCLITPC